MATPRTSECRSMLRTLISTMRAEIRKTVNTIDKEVGALAINARTLSLATIAIKLPYEPASERLSNQSLLQQPTFRESSKAEVPSLKKIHRFKRTITRKTTSARKLERKKSKWLCLPNKNA